MNCPRCRTRLNRTRVERGVLFDCPRCHGRAAGVSLLRQLGSTGGIRGLWLRAKQAENAAGAPCPVCRRAMAEVPLSDGHGAPMLDVCVGCQFVWFDPREFEQLPPRETGEPKPLPEKARELIALERLRQDIERTKISELGEPGPDEWWQWIPVVLGLPVEHETSPLSNRPWLTWGLAATLVAVYVLTAGNLEAVVDEFGLAPAKFWRHGGITLLTSFFLHGGVWHLLGNVYFLLIFGDNVEDDLGRWHFAALLIVASLFGDLCHKLGHPHDIVPAIGASGGISGAITYYALRFPRARLGFLFRWWLYFRWISIPAYMALLLWFLLQLLYVHHELTGVGNVAALAHLGGAAVGVGAWLLWRAGSLRKEELI